MKTIILILISILALTQVQGYKKINDVYELNQSNIMQATEEFEYLLILFYTPTCQHCRKFIPVYESLAQEYANSKEISVAIASVNVQEHPKAGDQFGIDQYPTVIMVNQNSYSYFMNERTEDNLRKWIAIKTKQVNLKVIDRDHLDKLRKEYYRDNVAIYLGKEPLENQYYAYRIFCNALKGQVETSHTFNPQVAESLGVTELPTLILYKQGREVRYNKEDMTLNELEEFFLDTMSPHIQEYSQFLREKIFGEGMPSVLLIQENETPDSDAYKIFEKVARIHQGELPEFVTIALSSIEEASEQTRLLGKLGLKREELPKVMAVIYDRENNFEKYLYQGTLTLQDEALLGAFIQSYKKGDAELYIKSQDPIAFNSEKSVQQVVRSNYQEKIVDSKEHTIIAFGTEWCDACKQFYPKLEKLGQQLKESNSNIKIFTIDYEKNDIEGALIEYFPQIYIYKKEEGQETGPRRYQKESDINQLYHAIKEIIGEQFVEIPGYEKQNEHEQQAFDRSQTEQQQQEEKIDL